MKNKIILILLPIILIGLIGFYFYRRKSKIMVKNFKIRNDSWGLGRFGASRDGGKRKHNGIDLLTKKGEPIYAPFDLSFIRTTQPYKNDSKYIGGFYNGGIGTLKIFYMNPITSKRNFKKGDIIGYSQAISEKYSGAMKNHIHVEIRDKQNNILNPSKYI